MVKARVCGLHPYRRQRGISAESPSESFDPLGGVGAPPETVDAAELVLAKGQRRQRPVGAVVVQDSSVDIRGWRRRYPGLASDGGVDIQGWRRMAASISGDGGVDIRYGIRRHRSNGIENGTDKVSTERKLSSHTVRIDR